MSLEFTAVITLRVNLPICEGTNKLRLNKDGFHKFVQKLVLEVTRNKFKTRLVMHMYVFMHMEALIN
jgi:hypothetical protein